MKELICPKAIDECIGKCSHSIPHNKLLKCFGSRCSLHGDKNIDCSSDIRAIRKYKLKKLSTDEKG